MNSSVQSKSQTTSLNANLVNIYLRNYKKMAIVIQIQTPIKNIHLKKIIATKLNTNEQNLGIFANGERIDNIQEKLIQLKDKAIVHIVQLDRTRGQKLVIHFKYNAEYLKVETTPKTQIRTVIHQYIEPFFQKGEKDVFLAYTAKPINIFKTFQDQLVQNQSQIIILDFKPAKNKYFQVITQSQYSKHVSTTSTKMVGMPVMGGRNPNSIKMQKEKMAQLNKSKFGPTNSSIQEELVPELEKPQVSSSGGKKLTDSEEKYAAPHAAQENAAPLMYQGFDPHHPSKIGLTIKLEQKQPHKKETLSKANPQHEAQPQQNPYIKQKDLLFMGHMTMQQTENFSAGAIQQSKQNFLKKKSLLAGKQNKMINHN